MTNWVNVVGPCAATDRSLQGGGSIFLPLPFLKKNITLDGLFSSGED